MVAPRLNIVAQTAGQLIDLLQAVDIRVPLLPGRKDNLYRERYMMAYFLATLADSKNFEYPINVKHQDRPDFSLAMNDERVGVECVEAVPTEWRKISDIRDRDYPHAFNWGQKFSPRDEVFSKKERRAIASGNIKGLPWVGDSAEREWADAIQFFIEKKTERLRSEAYGGFSRNWLLVQDEWRVPISEAEEIRHAVDVLSKSSGSVHVRPCFDSVFILCRGWLISLLESGYTMVPLRDLWKDA